MKISLSSLERTNFAHPSEWEGKSDSDEPVKISYRYGEIKIFVNDKHHTTTDKNDLDLGGFMEDEELKQILIRDDLAVD